jgi:hypothetical protein
MLYRPKLHFFFFLRKTVPTWNHVDDGDPGNADRDFKMARR